MADKEEQMSKRSTGFASTLSQEMFASDEINQKRDKRRVASKILIVRLARKLRGGARLRERMRTSSLIKPEKTGRS